jgi:hypothetical protein
MIPPKLVIDAIAEPNPFLREFLGKARPGAQLNKPWVSDYQDGSIRMLCNWNNRRSER